MPLGRGGTAHNHTYMHIDSQLTVDDFGKYLKIGGR